MFSLRTRQHQHDDRVHQRDQPIRLPLYNLNFLWKMELLFVFQLVMLEYQSWNTWFQISRDLGGIPVFEESLTAIISQLTRSLCANHEWFHMNTMIWSISDITFGRIRRHCSLSKLLWYFLEMILWLVLFHLTWSRLCRCFCLFVAKLRDQNVNSFGRKSSVSKHLHILISCWIDLGLECQVW